MHYAALAIDYDGTLARNGRVDAAALDALERLKRAGRTLFLVTGRRLDDLRDAFPEYTVCHRIVAENGALLHRPATDETLALAPPVPAALVQALSRKGVQPLEVGAVIVATRVPHEKTVIDTLRELALDHEVTFNKASVLVLPPGVTKATGLAAALEDLDIPADSVVGIGDAENDQAFLSLVGLPVAVADAVPSIREEAAWVTQGGAGAGVVELIDRLLIDDLAGIPTVPRPRTGADTDEAGGGPIRIV
ncbi:HAD family hydrolase [Azospirillum sp.]|uniref:HAD family hydrolase n=1 Tax=Azospirillum sp. TaxID=34012 RepID=UPI002D3EC06C|nr:HAD family hydrolase [Azospirillum sp.]HYD64860.1 HAD family hydrolase [Azospirillum sp.]